MGSQEFKVKLSLCRCVEDTSIFPSYYFQKLATSGNLFAEIERVYTRIGLQMSVNVRRLHQEINVTRKIEMRWGGCYDALLSLSMISTKHYMNQKVIKI